MKTYVQIGGSKRLVRQGTGGPYVIFNKIKQYIGGASSKYIVVLIDSVDIDVGTGEIRLSDGDDVQFLITIPEGFYFEDLLVNDKVILLGMDNAEEARLYNDDELHIGDTIYVIKELRNMLFEAIHNL